MPDRLRRVAEVARFHDGVFHRAAWAEHGLGSDALHRAIVAGRVERLGPRTYRFAGQPDSWMQRARAGVFDLGPESAVAGDVCARLLGLDGFGKAEMPTFLVPSGLRNRSTVGVVRSSATWSSVDVITHDSGLRILSASRLIVEEAGRWNPNELTNAVTSAIRLGWTSEAYLRRRLQSLRHRGRPGVLTLDRLLALSVGHSWLEQEALQLLADARIAVPTTQQVHRTRQGFVARVDFTWTDELVIVEVNGGTHHASRAQLQRDAQRHTELTLLGYRVLTFVYDDVVARPAWVVNSIRSALSMAH